MSYWFIVHDLKAYEQLNDMIGCRVKSPGLRRPWFKQFAEIRKGDKIVYYTTRNNVVVGIFDVSSDLTYLPNDPEWKEIVVYTISPVEMPPEGFYLDFKKALTADKTVELDLFPKKDRWYGYLQGKTVRKLTDHDYLTIEGYMRKPEFLVQKSAVKPKETKWHAKSAEEMKVVTVLSDVEYRDKKIRELQDTLRLKEDRIRQLEAQIGPSPLVVIIQKLGNIQELSPEVFEWILKRAFEELGFDAKWNGELKDDKPQQCAPAGKPDVEVKAPLAGDPYYMVVEATKMDEERYQVTEVHGAVDHSRGFPGLPFKTCYRLVIAPRFRKGAIEASKRMDPKYPVMLLTSQDFLEILKFHSEVGGITQEELKHLLDNLDGRGEIGREHIEEWEKTVKEQRKRLSLALTVYDILYSDKEFMWARDIWRELKKQRGQENLPCESLQDVHDVLKILDTIGALVVKPDTDIEKYNYKAGLTPEGFRLRIRKLEETVRLQESKQPTRTDKISSWTN